MQKFIAEESFWNLFPEARIGIIVARGMKSADEVPAEQADAISRLLVAANGMAETHLTSNTFSENEVVKAWRDAYRLFKTKKGARCSIENLLKRVLKGNPVRSITPSVDIYNAISLKYATRRRRRYRRLRRRRTARHHRWRRRLRAARRGRGRPHACGRIVLSRRRGSHLPLLELARRPTYGLDGRLEKRLPHHRVRRARPRRRLGSRPR